MPKRILFLAAAGESDQATQHRITPIADELRQRGYRCTVLLGDERTIGTKTLRHVTFSALVELLTDSEKYDVVVINRDSSPIAYSCALVCSRTHTPLVFDLDDALYNQMTIGATKVPNPGRLFLQEMVDVANHVTTGNARIRDELSKYNSEVTAIPTPVDKTIFHPNVEQPVEYESTVIGWMGVAHGHEENLRLLRRPLIELGKEYDFTFRIISALGNERVREIFNNVEEWVDIDYGYDGRVPMKQIAHEMATFDVAALPLSPSDKMMEGKSVIKVVEHLAMKIPVVASDALAYGDVLTHGETGLLAASSEEWEEYLEFLIKSSERRATLAESGYEMVQNGYTVESYTDELELIIERL